MGDTFSTPPWLGQPSREEERENARHHLGRLFYPWRPEVLLAQNILFVLVERLCTVLMMLRSLGLRTKYVIRVTRISLMIEIQDTFSDGKAPDLLI